MRIVCASTFGYFRYRINSVRDRFGDTNPYACCYVTLLEQSPDCATGFYTYSVSIAHVSQTDIYSTRNKGSCSIVAVYYRCAYSHNVCTIPLMSDDVINDDCNDA